MELFVCYEFAVNRRVPWEGDETTLRTHIGEVRQVIADHGAIADVRAESNLATARVVLEVRVVAPNQPTAEIEARQIVARGIRTAGAYHSGLLSEAEEMTLRPDLSPWSGLRTPTWQVRRTTINAHRGASRAGLETPRRAN